MRYGRSALRKTTFGKILLIYWLGWLQRYTADPDAAFVAHHGRHKRPAVSLWVVHLHRAEVGLAVVAPDGVQMAAVRDQRDSTAPRVHCHQMAPLLACRAVHLGTAQETRAVVAAHHVELTAQSRCTVPAPLVEHGGQGVPLRRVLVVILHLEDQSNDGYTFYSPEFKMQKNSIYRDKVLLCRFAQF